MQRTAATPGHGMLAVCLQPGKMLSCIPQDVQMTYAELECYAELSRMRQIAITVSTDSCTMSGC